MGWTTLPTPSERPDSVFRSVLPFECSITRIALVIVVGVALMLLTATGVDAAETAVSTPTAWEYAYETAPVAERQVVPSTAADLRLATSLSIAAVLVIATMVVGERQPTESASPELAPVADASRQPAVIRPLAPAEVLPEAA